MHGGQSHGRGFGSLLSCILFLTVACSSGSAPVVTVQTITPASHRASPTPRTSDTALITYAGHTQAILSLAWSPNGRYIASGSNDTTVHVWDAVTGKRILIYHGHKTGVTAISWSPDGTRIASGSGFLLQSTGGEAAISDNVVQVACWPEPFPDSWLAEVVEKQSPLFFLYAVAASLGLFLCQDSKMATALQKRLMRDSIR